MKYCSECGAAVRLRVPPGDNRERYVCDACGVVHYQNPRIIAGCLVESGNRVLLCRRAIEPRFGLWTLPAGFMENGETTEQAAARETWEEARARVAEPRLYSLFSLPHINQVYLLFRCRLAPGGYGAGTESLEVRLFEEAEIPWDQLAFPTIRKTLEYYFADRANGGFPLRTGTITRTRSGVRIETDDGVEEIVARR